MRFRRILREFTDFPATTTIGLLWIAVYVAMAWYQGTPHAGPDWLRGGIQQSTSHVFGDLTSRELYAGQVWRVVTATFVHYGLLHIGLNLLSLYQLGRVVEDWYGTGRFVLLYVLLGGLGNLLAGLARPWLPAISGSGDPWNAHSGGGSTAIFGLVTLLGVGAWRSRTRFGDYAKGIILFLLVLNGVIAYVLRHYLDHYGHAGGAIVGALVGLAHPWLSRDPEGPGSRRAGWLGAAVLVACAGAQVWVDRAERAEAERRILALISLKNLNTAVQARFRGGLRPVPIPLTLQPPALRLTPSKPPKSPDRPSETSAAVRVSLSGLDAHKGQLDAGPTADAYHLMHAVAARAVARPPNPWDFRAFLLAWDRVNQRAGVEAVQAAPVLQALRRAPTAAPTPRPPAAPKRAAIPRPALDTPHPPAEFDKG